MDYVLMAPTGRAAKVLSNYTQRSASTIHKKIYLVETYPDGGIRMARAQNKHKNTLFIVDEASMIGEEHEFGARSLLDDLLEYVLSLMQSEAGANFESLNVDGGASANNLLLKIQADLLGKKVIRPTCIETTALGAAYLAGLAVGAIESTDSILSNRAIDTLVEPEMDIIKRMSTINEWNKAVERSKGWAEK